MNKAQKRALGIIAGLVTVFLLSLAVLHVPFAGAGTTRDQCIAAADAANYQRSLARAEYGRLLNIADLATASGDTTLADESTAAADSLLVVVNDIYHRVARAGEDIDNGQYADCAIAVRPWL